MIKLDCPLAVFDLETTGANIATDRIIEIAIIKIHPDGTQSEYHKLVNPEMPISPEATSVHGFSNKDVCMEPTFGLLVDEIDAFLEGCDIGGFHSNSFDVPILCEEYSRVGKRFDMDKRRFIDARAIYHKMEPRNLSAAFKYYCDKELENAHSALYDARATADVILAQAERYEALKGDIDIMNTYSRSGNKADFAGRFAYKGETVVFNFGKHKGKTLGEVLKSEPGYYSWMMNAQFTQNTLDILKAEKEKLNAQ
jgi:DNA polymerase-3 subunit epsilon